MTDDYERQRRIQDDIGFKTGAFVAGMAHYFSLVFVIACLPNLAGQVRLVCSGTYNPLMWLAQLLWLPESRRLLITLLVILVVNAVVFAGLVVYSRIVFRYAAWRTAVGRVVLHEIFPFGLCLVLDLFV